MARTSDAAALAAMPDGAGKALTDAGAGGRPAALGLTAVVPAAAAADAAATVAAAVKSGDPLTQMPPAAASKRCACAVM